MPFIDVVVSRTADGRRVFIKAVNTDAANAPTARIKLNGLSVASQAEVATLTAKTLATANSFTAPRASEVQRTTIAAGSDFLLPLPKRSVSVVTLNVGAQP